MSGTLSASNSLVGSASGDAVGDAGVFELSNGNFVVDSIDWSGQFGAVTWVSGASGLTGPISVSNSLVGSAPGDLVGDFGVAALTNGNYVVQAPLWHNGSMSAAGAATWGNGNTGVTGIVSASNSLVGSAADDRVGAGVVALSNGNYVVQSPNWSNGSPTNIGAVTWGSGVWGVTVILDRRRHVAHGRHVQRGDEVQRLDPGAGQG